MILLHSTPRAEEDKVALQLTFAHLKEKHNTPLKVTEQKSTNMDDHPSASMTL